MKRLFFVILFFALIPKVFAGEIDSLLIRLNKIMDNKDYYVKIREQNIQQIKETLGATHLTEERRYDIHLKLYEKYKKFRSDSAAVYTLKNLDIANKLGRKDLKQENTIHLAWLYSILGMYIEAQDLLENFDRSDLPERLLADYYETCSDFYSRYGQSTDNPVYYKKSEQYRDSLLTVLDPQSLKYRITYASKLLYSYQDVERTLKELLSETTDEDPERGLIAYYLGFLYKMEDNKALSEKYFMISAISDIENCVKDNASLRELALVYYETGNIDRAYKFMQSAIDDALFCNARYRAIEISASYPIINASYRVKEENQKNSLQVSLIIISILSLFLIMGIAHTYSQMKKLSLIREELSNTNRKLSELNQDLLVVNNRLKDSNHIKEEYIAHFFDLCSMYINKLESYRKTLNKHASNKHWDELFGILRSTTLIETELEELYKKFDVIFLTLYPSFVEEFNALQIKEEQIILKPGELLNTELRIFALIRLGITDSVKIAGFLRYSISTIYNYRVKARNNASVSRDLFEDKVMAIGTAGLL